MSWEQEVEELAATIKPSEPIYSINMSGDKARLIFNKTRNVSSDSDSYIVKDILLPVARETIVDGKHLVHFVYGNAQAQVWNKVDEDITVFLLHYSKFKNPKLSLVYRWWRNHINGFGRIKLSDYVAFQNDTFQLWKYLRSKGVGAAVGDIPPTDINNGIGLINLIKEKYEKKGVLL